jgi:tetratricopeptide (TPR) repeat protein
VELGLSSRAASTFQSSDNTANRPGDLPDLVEGLLRVGQWSAALERILGAADAENLFTDTALAIACADAGLWPAAIQHALRGHGLVEDSPVSNHVAAKVLCLGGRPQQAVDFARTYERLLPRDITSQLWLAECLADSGHRSDAQSVFQTLIARLEKKVYLDASDLQAHAFSLLWIGRTTQAAEAFLRALSATDRTPAVLFNLALCSALEGDGRQAQLLLRKARDDAQRLPLPTRRGVTAVAMHDLEVLASAASSAGTTEIDEMRHVLQQDINRFDANWTDYLDRLTNHEELRKRPSFDRIVSSITPEQK